MNVVTFFANQVGPLVVIHLISAKFCNWKSTFNLIQVHNFYHEIFFEIRFFFRQNFLNSGMRN